jgi:hypothetical protein
MIQEENIGSYRGTQSGLVFDVVRITTFTPHTNASTGQTVFRPGAIDYRTACGIELNANSKDESSFQTLEGENLAREA